MAVNPEFHIAFDWLDSDLPGLSERATYADIKIAADRTEFTELEDLNAQTVRSTIRASAFHVAQWFSFNWWRLRWEPQDTTFSWKMAHNLAAAGGGYAWPNLIFSSDGEFILIQNFRSSPSETMPVRYLNEVSTNIRAIDVENQMALFIEAVIERLAQRYQKNEELAALWNTVQHERRDEQTSSRRKREALMGFDREEASEELMSRIEEASENHGSDAVSEVAAAAKGRFCEQLDAIQSLNGTTFDASPDSVEELRQDLQNRDFGFAEPWEKAKVAADRARKFWDIGEGPVSNPKLAELSGIRESDLDDCTGKSRLPMSIGLRVDGDMKIYLNKHRPEGRRFALGRLLADQIFSAATTDHWFPVTDAKTSRQKFQRAFAQELLCPFRELREQIGNNDISEEFIEDTASQYFVSPLLIRSTLANHGAIGRDDV